MIRLKLQARYTIAIAALVVATAIVLSWALLYEFQSFTRSIAVAGTNSVANDLLEHIEKRATTATAELARDARNPLYQYNFDKLLNLIEDLITEEHTVVAVEIYDAEGRVVHDGNKVLRRFGAATRNPALVRTALETREMIKERQTGELRISYPIYLGDKAIGGVLVIFSLEKMTSEANGIGQNISRISEAGLNGYAYTVASVALILAALAGVFGMILASRLIQPIKELAVYSKQIGKGDYSVSIKIDRDDELGDLAKAFDEMRQNLRQSSEEIRFLAYHDRLTGLPNRAMFRGHLDRAMAEARRNGHVLALLFIDVDNFKRINDTFGHAAGDLVLQTQASRISGCLRAADFVAAAGKDGDDAVAARLGGDEFIAVAPLKNNALDASTLARRILNQCEQPIELESRSVVVSTSIGIAIFPGDGNTPDELIQSADMAMYQAKNEGKNTYKYFTESLNQSAHHKVETELELRAAIEQGQLTVHYQPQVDLDTRKVVGAEALIRWQHPTRGLIGPNEFITVAEDTGLILPIGREVLRQAAKQVASWRANGYPDFYVSVNVSSLQFRRQDLVDVIKDVLAETNAPPDSIHIELTESNLMKAEDQAKPQLQQIRALGIRVWLDDFGTGYSSLSYLHRFPVDGVKIDRSFVAELGVDDNSRALTRTIIAMAESMHMVVIAEGVENKNQEALLKADGCHHAQGYLYGRPLPAQELEALLQTERRAANA